MKEKIPGSREILPVLLLAVMIIQLLSCSSRGNIRGDSDPVMGRWKTNQNVFLTVHRMTGNEVVAEITSSPGFFSTDLGAGHIIVHDIQLLSPGRYSGLFAMPGNEKPIKVQLRFMNRNTIAVETPDRRAQGNKILWRRMTPPESPKP